jgi:hypothetical protein
MLDGDDTVIYVWNTSGSFPGSIDIWGALSISSLPASRPFKLAFQDTTASGQNTPLGSTFDLSQAVPGATLEFDPATLDPSCARYPFVGAPSPSPTAPTAQIQSFLDARAGLLLANAPDASRRFGRLNGQSAPPTFTGGDVLSYLDVVATTGALPVSGSLSAFEAFDEAGEPRAFDVWIDGTFALFETGNGNGRFSSGSIGADYLVTPDLLIGGFASLDNLDRFETMGDTLSGTGWLAGPYVTARLTDTLYLDLLGAAGTAGNSIERGGVVDDFGSTRWLVNATLEGQWSEGPWTFAPRLSAGYVEERSEAYTGANGVAVPSVVASTGRVSGGPGIVHTTTTEGLTTALSLRLDAIAQLGTQSSYGAAIEGGIELTSATGTRFGARLGLTGLTAGTRSLSLSVNAGAGF